MQFNKAKVKAVFDMYLNGTGEDRHKETAKLIKNLNKRELVTILIDRTAYKCWIPHIGNRDLNYDFERFVSRSINGFYG